MDIVKNNRIFLVCIRLIYSLHENLGIILGFNNGDITYKIIRRILAKIPAPMVIDVGANIGEFSALCLNSNRNCKIIAIEPQEELNDKLSTNLNGNVTILNKALSSKSETFAFSRRNIGDRKAHLNSSKESKQSTLIKSTTLDEIVSEHSISNIDILKIDTEGFDFEVLLGAEETLKLNKIKCLIFEIVPQLLFHKQIPSEIENYIRKYGFSRIYRVSKTLGLVPVSHLNNYELATQNILAIHDNSILKD